MKEKIKKFCKKHEKKIIWITGGILLIGTGAGAYSLAKSTYQKGYNDGYELCALASDAIIGYAVSKNPNEKIKDFYNTDHIISLANEMVKKMEENR